MLKSLWRDVRASLNRIFAIVVKEFAVTFGDKGSRMVLIAPVFLQAILFGYGATFNLERVPWVLLDESHSSASAEIVRGITGQRHLRPQAKRRLARRLREEHRLE